MSAIKTIGDVLEDPQFQKLYQSGNVPEIKETFLSFPDLAPAYMHGFFYEDKHLANRILFELDKCKEASEVVHMIAHSLWNLCLICVAQIKDPVGVNKVVVEKGKEPVDIYLINEFRAAIEEPFVIYRLIKEFTNEQMELFFIEFAKKYDGNSPIFFAAENGQSHAVYNLMQKHPELVKKTIYQEREKLLPKTVEKEHIRLLNFLLKQLPDEAKVEFYTNRADLIWEPIKAVIYQSNPKMIKVLIDNYPEKCLPNFFERKEFVSCFKIASAIGQAEVFEELIKRCPQPILDGLALDKDALKLFEIVRSNDSQRLAILFKYMSKESKDKVLISCGEDLLYESSSGATEDILIAECPQHVVDSYKKQLNSDLNDFDEFNIDW